MARSRTLNFILAADAKQVQRAFNQAEKAGDRYGKHAQGVHARVTKSWHGMATGALKAAGGITAAYVSIAKAHDAISATEDLAKATVGLHRNLGLSVQEASRWGAVAKARDIDNKSLTMSFTTLSRRVQDANAGGVKQQEMFKQLGLSQKDLRAGTHDFTGLVTQLADGFGKLHGGTQRQALAQQLLGRGYQSVLPLFAEGSKSLQEQLHWADQYGVTLNKKTIGPINELIKSQRQLKVANLGLKAQFTTAVAPALLEVEDAALKVLRVMNDKRLTGEERWKKIGDIVGPIADKIGDGVTSAMPKIAEGVGEHAPQVASAFANGFLKANVWGKLAIAGWLLTKFGGIGAFTALGRRGGTAVATGMATTATGGAALSRLSRTVGALKIGGGYLAGAWIGQRIVAGIVRQIPGDLPKHIADTLEGKTGINKVAPKPSLTNPTGVPNSTKPSTATQTRQFNQMADAIKRGQINLSRLNDLLGKPGSSGFTKNQEKQLRSLSSALNQLPSGFRFLRNQAANNLSNLNKQVGINIGSIRRIMETDPKAGREAMVKDFRLAVRNVGRLLDDGKDHTGQALREIRRLMKVHSGAGAEALSKNTREAIGTLKRLMNAGVVSTRSGTREIRRLEAQALRGFGFSPKEAINITRGNSYTGGPEEGTRGAGHAAGGWIGMPGEAGGDNVPIMVGRGEAVLNRYQQAPVENALRTVYGMGLDDLFGAIQRPHYMAKGGFAGGGRIGAMVQAASRIDSQHYPYRWGGGHNDSFSGPYDCSGAVSAILHAGGILQHPMVSGQLANFGKPGAGPVTVFANDTHTYMRIGGRYFGTSNANPGGGAGWFNGAPRAGFAVRHVDASGGTVSAPKVTGPASPLKRLVRTALGREASGANQQIMRLIASMGQTGGGDWGDFGAPGKKGRFGLSALARLWQQAGGDPRYSGLMAHVAMAESTGNPSVVNSIGATGLWQIYGKPFPGNAKNPLVNARMAVAKFGAAGRHPLSPWYSSIGGWRQFVGGLPFARGGRVGGRMRSPVMRRPKALPRFATGGYTIADPDPWSPPEYLVTHGVPGGSGMFAGVGVSLVPVETVTADTGTGEDPNQALIDAENALADAIRAQTDALNAAKDEIAKQNAFAQSITAVTGREALRALSDVVNGNLGYRTQQRLNTPSFGAVARA